MIFPFKVSKDSFSMKFFVFGIGVSTRCGPLSIVDFTYFVWQNFERISSKQYAITLSPSDFYSFSTPPILINSTALSTPRLICLMYHRAASDGWRELTTVWKIRIVWVRNMAAALRTLALVENVYVNPQHSLIRRFVSIPRWSIISPISN